MDNLQLMGTLNYNYLLAAAPRIIMWSGFLVNGAVNIVINKTLGNAVLK
jgi:hypothetical protein